MSDVNTNDSEYQRGFKAGYVLGSDEREREAQRAHSEGEAEGSDRTLEGCYKAIKGCVQSGTDNATKIERIKDVLKKWKRELTDREIITPEP